MLQLKGRELAADGYVLLVAVPLDRGGAGLGVLMTSFKHEIGHIHRRVVFRETTTLHRHPLGGALQLPHYVATS